MSRQSFPKGRIFLSRQRFFDRDRVDLNKRNYVPTEKVYVATEFGHGRGTL